MCLGAVARGQDEGLGNMLTSTWLRKRRGGGGGYVALLLTEFLRT